MENYVLKFKIAVTFFLLVLPGYIIAQNGAVTGKITDSELHEGIPQVLISEKGTSNAIISDLDGNYRIELKTASPILVINLVGMKSQEVAVKPGQVVDISMIPVFSQLNEVVVTGYSTQKKTDLTGAVSVVSMKDVMKASENNPMKAIQGRVAGMEVSGDGAPGGTATIRIRGVGTLNNNDPLYVIDGVPTKSGMQDLNSNDIENIQVLKDASAASIYGSRAANGVIIITTKQGKDGQLKVNFDAYHTSSWYQNRLEVLNAKEYGQALWQATTNSGGNPNDNNVGYNFDSGIDANGNPVLNGIYVPRYMDGANTLRSSDTDWFKEVSRTGSTQSYNLSVSNGTKDGKYFFSVGSLSNDGMIKNSDFSRVSARMNSDYKIFGDVLTIGENFSINKTKEVGTPYNILDAALKACPLIPVHTVDGIGWGGPTGGMNDRQNPVRLLDANKDNASNLWRVFGNAFVNLQPIKNLNIRSSYGIDYSNTYKRYMTTSYTSGYLKNDLTSTSLEQGHNFKSTWSNTISYAKEIGKHQVDALVGMEMCDEDKIDFAAYREGFTVQTPSYMWPDAGSGKANSSGTANGYALLSYFGKVNYSYDNRYLASATVRYDGSSRFGENNIYGTFPAFSAGWRISQESFMSDYRSVVSDLKLRFGWGQTGNSEIPNTARYTIYVPSYGTEDPTWDVVNGTAYNMSGSSSAGILPSGYKLTQRGNANLKWETTTQTNIGLDFGFFDQTIYGSAEYYIKETSDILVDPPFIAVIGEGGKQYVNGASMENKGFEFNLGYRNSTSFGLTYDLSGNISSNRNKITKLPVAVENSYGGNGRGDNILGRPYKSMYGYVANGLFKTQDEVNNSAAQDGKGLGRIRYEDLNGDGKIDDNDRTWIGSPYPDFMYGININLAYKNFDFTAFFNGEYGRDLDVSAIKKQTDFWSIEDSRSNKGTRLLDAWTPSNSNSTIPALQSLNVNNEGRMSTYFIEKGSYMKLRNLQIGYSLPKQLSQKIKMEKLRVYASGQNLFMIKSKSFTGVDPENSQFGYPIPITLTLGLNVTF